MPSKLRQIVKTWTTDNAEILTDVPLIFTSLDIQILTFGAYFGTINSCEFELAVNSIVSYRNEVDGIDISQFYFMNQGAGDNIKVVINGILK